MSSYTRNLNRNSCVMNMKRLLSEMSGTLLTRPSAPSSALARAIEVRVWLTVNTSCSASECWSNLTQQLRRQADRTVLGRPQSSPNFAQNLLCSIHKKSGCWAIIALFAGLRSECRSKPIDKSLAERTTLRRTSEVAQMVMIGPACAYGLCSSSMASASCLADCST